GVRSRPGHGQPQALRRLGGDRVEEEGACHCGHRVQVGDELPFHHRVRHRGRHGPHGLLDACRGSCVQSRGGHRPGDRADDRARRAAYGASGAYRRLSDGVLGEAARAHWLTQDVVLGVLAAMTDLRQVVRGRSDPAKIQPQRTSLLNWAQDSRWRPTHYPLPVQNHGTEFSLPSRPRAAAIHTVDVGPLVLPIALQPEQGDVLTVLLQGAVDRAKLRLPIFLRWRYQIDLGFGPTLALADPTLDLSGAMRLGWY